jgi:hypothetical protein
MVHTQVIGDDIQKGIEALKEYVPQVAMEMLSKSGNAIRDAQRRELKRTTTKQITVSKNGYQYLKPISVAIPFGHREQDNKTANPDNMASFITSYLMEKHLTVVVNGTHKAFRPIIRRDGDPIGVGSRVGSTSKQTHAILQRMNDDKLDPYYPKRTQLSTNRIGTGYAQRGNSSAQGKINHYLVVAYTQALQRIEQKKRTQIDFTL